MPSIYMYLQCMTAVLGKEGGREGGREGCKPTAKGRATLPHSAPTNVVALPPSLPPSPPPLPPGTIIVIASVNGWFLPAVLPPFLLYYFAQNYYVPSSR